VKKKVFISGIGIISSIGNNVIEVLNSLIHENSGIIYSEHLHSVYKNEIPVGEVRLTDEELKELLQLRNKLQNSRTTLLGMLAVSEALKNANILDINEFNTALISATTVGGMDKSELFYREFINNKTKGKLKYIYTHDCGESTEVIANHFKLKGFTTTISTACSSSANSIMFGARLIKNGLAERVIAGGTDALSLFTINGFNTLMILSHEHCRPFDETRNGLNIGEGAGYIVMESEDSIKKSGKQAIAELKGYGNACDAYHQTASSPDGYGAYLAMNKAIGNANILPNNIDYVNVHGTGTPNNDLSEGLALQNIFNNDVPYFSSTKSATGHTLGASGGIEAVISILAIQNKIIFPSLNFSQQMKELTICPTSNKVENIEIKNVLSNSFGFGGNNTSLIFSAV